MTQELAVDRTFELTSWGGRGIQQASMTIDYENPHSTDPRILYPLTLVDTPISTWVRFPEWRGPRPD